MSEATAKPNNIKVKPEFPTRDITLERSKITVTIPEDWHISDAQAAQRASKGDGSRMQLLLMQRVCLFNFERWTLTEIEEKIKGKDFMQLLGEFYSDDEDGEGND